MAPVELIGSVVVLELEGTGSHPAGGRYLSLVHTYTVTQTIQIRGIMTAEKYNRIAPHKKYIEKIKK